MIIEETVSQSLRASVEQKLNELEANPALCPIAYMADELKAANDYNFIMVSLKNDHIRGRVMVGKGTTNERPNLSAVAKSTLNSLDHHYDAQAGHYVTEIVYFPREEILQRLQQEKSIDGTTLSNDEIVGLLNQN